MKKQITSISAIALLATAVFYTGCKKDDVEAPVVTITGSDLTISLQGTYNELGATATDNEDGTLTPQASGVVDVNMTGTYTITYSASDAAGNTGTAKRTVIVKNDSDAMTGTYTCTIAGTPAYTYTQSITASTTLNNRIKFGKFGDYNGNTGIYANITGNTVDLPSQTTATAVGTPAAIRTFAGTGLKNSAGFGLTYTETTSGTPATFNEVFVKN